MRRPRSHGEVAAQSSSQWLLREPRRCLANIIDWALRARDNVGRLIEVNPNETFLSSFATETIRQPAAVALPKLIAGILSAG